jgi:hypothetical protein
MPHRSYPWRDFTKCVAAKDSKCSRTVFPILAISIGEKVEVQTWNNSVSDVVDHTLIEPGTLLHSTLAAMAVGQLVRFSGSFFPSEIGCIRETSMTLGGSMDEPEFLMRFRTVEAAN